MPYFSPNHTQFHDLAGVSEAQAVHEVYQALQLNPSAHAPELESLPPASDMFAMIAWPLLNAKCT